MAIPTIYTGKHQAQPKLGAGAVLAPMAKAVLEETRRRELKREKNEAEFLKMAQTENPFNSISNATNEKMEQAMNDLLEWEAELYASTEGNLDVKQKLELTRKVKDHQNKIGRLQQAEMEVAQGLATAMKDPDKWDLGAAKEAYDNYIKTGEASNPLSPRPISPAEFYSNNPLSKDFFNITETAKKQGAKEIKTKQVSLDKNSNAFIEKVQADLFSNQGLLKNAVTTFSALPESKQKEYFKMAQENGIQAQQDLTGDRIVDARDNAVFLSHVDEVYKSMPLSKTIKEDIQTPSSGATFTFGQGKIKGNSFEYSNETQSAFSEGTGKGLIFTTKTGFDVSSKFLKDSNGNKVPDMPTTVSIKPLRLRDGKLEVEVKYSPSSSEGMEAFLNDGKAKTETLYININDVKAKLKAEYPDIEEAINKYGLSKSKEVKKKTFNPTTYKWE